MGNKQQTSLQVAKYHLNHPNFSNASLIISEGCSEVELIKPTSSKLAIKQWKNYVQNHRIPPLESQVLFLPKSIKHEQDWCGNNGIVKATYNAPPLLLSDELQNRIAIMQPFQEQQIWYSLYIVTYAAWQLRLKGLVLGDVRPKNIFLFEDGNIAIGCTASFFQEMPNYLKTLKLNQRTFLAPQQLNALVINRPSTQNLEASEDYSIGMTFLGLILLHDQENLYLSEVGDFDHQKFHIQLQSLASCQQYSPLLRKIVLGLLEKQIDQRLSANQVIRLLRPYEQSILMLEKFRINPSSDVALVRKIDDIDLEKYESILTKQKIDKFERLVGLNRQESPQIKVQVRQRNQPSLIIVEGNNNRLDPLLSPTNGALMEKKSKQPVQTALNVNIFSRQIKTPQNKSIYEKFADNVTSKSMDTKFSKIKPANLNSKQNSIQTISQREKKRIQTDECHYDDFPATSDVVPYQQSKLNKNSMTNYDANRISFNKNNLVQAPSVFILPPNEEKQTIMKNQSMQRVDPKMRSLQEIGRDAKSIRHTSQSKLLGISSTEKINEFSRVLKNIDEQLEMSRKMFPT